MTARFLDSKKFTTAHKNRDSRDMCVIDVNVTCFYKYTPSAGVCQPYWFIQHHLGPDNILSSNCLQEEKWNSWIGARRYGVRTPSQPICASQNFLVYATLFKWGKMYPIYIEPTFFLRLLTSFPVHTGDTKEVISTFVVLSRVGLSHLSV